MKNKSWRTTSLGIACILLGLHSFFALWLPIKFDAVWFNLVHVENGPIALIVVGIGLIHARDHKCKDATPPK